jgi:hypothetical protein
MILTRAILITLVVLALAGCGDHYPVLPYPVCGYRGLLESNWAVCPPKSLPL